MKKIIKTIFLFFDQISSSIRIFYSRIIKSENQFNLNIFSRIKIKLMGFTPAQYVLFDLDNNNKNEYLSEWYRWKTRKINGRYNLVLDDKILFEAFFKNSIPVVEHICLIKKGKVYFSKALRSDFAGRIEDLEPELLKNIFLNQKLVFKPNYGKGGGIGIFTVEFLDQYVLIDEKQFGYEELVKHLSNLDDYIANYFIEQHEYSSNLYPKTINTLRLVTVYNDEINKSELLLAAHRIGTKASYPVDNLSQGALVSMVDIKYGFLSNAQSYYETKSYSHHPETGNLIEGVRVPGWEKIVKLIEMVATTYFYIPYISWDVVVQDEGIIVIEGNGSTGLTLFQIWHGLRGTKFHELLNSHLEGR